MIIYNSDDLIMQKPVEAFCTCQGNCADKMLFRALTSVEARRRITKPKTTGI
jgi:hypothetical protein